MTFLLLGIATVAASGPNAYLTTCESIATVYAMSKIDCKSIEGTVQWIHTADVGRATVEYSRCASGKTKHMFQVTGLVYRLI